MFDNAWVDSLSPWRRSDLGRELNVMVLSAQLWGDPDHIIHEARYEIVRRAIKSRAY